MWENPYTPVRPWSASVAAIDLVMPSGVIPSGIGTPSQSTKSSTVTATLTAPSGEMFDMADSLRLQPP